MPKSYYDFKQHNKKFFYGLVGGGVLIQTGMSIATYYVMNYEYAAAESELVECEGLGISLYMIFVLHIFNGASYLVCLAGLEKYICKSVLMILFFVFNVFILSWC